MAALMGHVSELGICDETFMNVSSIILDGAQLR
jgi:hypothetical protein